jgi:hypothetical protein
VGSSPDEVDFFQFTLTFQQHCVPGVTVRLEGTEMSTRNLPGG